MPRAQKTQTLTPRLIGLTGGIATGKSTVTAYLRSKKIPVICADEISHQLTRKNAAGWKQIRKFFGTNFFLRSGELDRVRFADLVFNDVTAKLALEKILHPLVRKKMLQDIKRAVKNKNNKFIFLDVPLLFESGFDKLCDIVMCISSKQKLQLDRLLKTRHMTKSHALARIKSQMPMKVKIQHSDIVIENNGTIRELHHILALILGEL